MSPEKQTKDAGSQKQKIMIVAIIVVVLFVAWQVLGLRGGGNNNAAITPSSPSAPNAMGPKPMTAANGSSQMAPGISTPPPAPAPTPTAPQQVTLPAASTELGNSQSQAQTEYVNALNRLQLLKVKREIDETETAIATAELNRMTAEKSIADMILAKQQAAAAAQEVAPVPPPSTVAPTNAPPPPIMQPRQPEVAYTLQSVSYEGSKWSAVIS
jgi:hypothetical protein